MSIKSRLLLITALSLVCAACKKHESHTEVILEYSVPCPGLLESDSKMTDTLLMTETAYIQDSIERLMRDNNSSVEKIKSVRVVSLALYTGFDTSVSANFKDIAEISLYMDHPVPGKAKFAHKFIPDRISPVLYPDLETVELRDYLVRRGSSLILAYQKRRPLSHDLLFIGNLRLRIVAEPLD